MYNDEPEQDSARRVLGTIRSAEAGLGNISYIRHLWEAFRVGGVRAMARLMPPDVRWRPTAANGRVLNGTAELEAFWSPREVEVPSLRMFFGAADDVLVEAEYHRTAGNARTVWLLYRFEGDRLIEAIGFEDEAQARSYSAVAAQ